MSVLAVRRAQAQSESEPSLPFGTIIVILDDGRQLVFGPAHNDLAWLDESERPKVVAEAASLFDHSRRGRCWAADDRYDATARLLREFASHEGVPVNIV